MKQQIYLSYDIKAGRYNNSEFNPKKVTVRSNEWVSEDELLFKEMVINIPDDILLTEKEWGKQSYLKNLSLAEQEVIKKGMN